MKTATKRQISTSKKTPPTKRIRVGKLQSATEISRFMARIIKQAVRRGGDAECNVAYKLVTMASMLSKTLETSDLEKRIEALEDAKR